jgi:hypothetical protein
MNMQLISPCILHWKPDSYSAAQEIPRILWDLNINYCVHKWHPRSPGLIQYNPIHAITIHIFKIICNITQVHSAIQASLIKFVWILHPWSYFIFVSYFLKGLLTTFVLRFCHVFWWQYTNEYLSAFVSGSTSLLQTSDVCLLLRMISM